MRAELESRGRDPANVIEREESAIFNQHIDLVQAQSASYRRINAFARTIQVLSWVRSSLGALPEVPSAASTIQLNVPPKVEQKELVSPQIRALRSGQVTSEDVDFGDTVHKTTELEEQSGCRYWILVGLILLVVSIGLLGRRLWASRP